MKEIIEKKPTELPEPMELKEPIPLDIFKRTLQVFLVLYGTLKIMGNLNFLVCPFSKLCLMVGWQVYQQTY